VQTQEFGTTMAKNTTTCGITTGNLMSLAASGARGDVTRRDHQGMTPINVNLWESEQALYYALEHVQTQAVGISMAKATTTCGLTEGKPQIARRLWSRCRCNRVTIKAGHPLQVIGWMSEDVALLLLEHGEDPGIRTTMG